MANLKQLATELIDIIGEPFNHILYERVKDLIIHELATLVKLESDKSGIKEDWIMYCPIEVKKVDPADLPEIKTNKMVYRSINKLPKRIRLKHMSPIFYLGTVDRAHPFMYVSSYAIAIAVKNVNEVGDIPKYSLRNGYLECYVNDANLKLVSMGHAFVDTYSLPNQTSDKEHVDLVETDELLIDEDMIQLLKSQILKLDMSVIKPDDEIIKISDNDEVQKNIAQS